MQHTIGSQLREARIAHELSVVQLAEAVRLRPSVIQWLEADDFTPCGAPAYVRGYLRCVASYLDLASDDLVAAYSMEYEPQPANVAEAAPLRQASRKLPMIWFLVIITLVAALGYTLLANDSHARQTLPTTSGIPAFARSTSGRLVIATQPHADGNRAGGVVALRL